MGSVACSPGMRYTTMCRVRELAAVSRSACYHGQDWLGMQGMPEGHTEPCYPVRKPGINHHKQAPLSAADAEKRDVRPACPTRCTWPSACTATHTTLCFEHMLASTHSHLAPQSWKPGPTSAHLTCKGLLPEFNLPMVSICAAAGLQVQAPGQCSVSASGTLAGRSAGSTLSCQVHCGAQGHALGACTAGAAW